MRFMLTENPLLKSGENENDWKPGVSTDLSYLDDRDTDWIVWLGHAAYLFQLGGKRYLTDPQFSDMPLIPRRVQPPFPLEKLRGIDYLLLSHDHRDHVDKKSIQTILANNQIEKILAPLRLQRTIGKWIGETPLEEAGWYQIFQQGHEAVRITYLPARHWCRRGLIDFNRTLWGSFMLEYGGKSYYFGGDSAKTDYWPEIGEMFPNIEVAMLGIGAYSPRYMMEDNHANPAEAYWGYQSLGARYWWPMHHGTYNLSTEPAGEPISLATDHMRKDGLEDRLIHSVINRPWTLGAAIH